MTATKMVVDLEIAGAQIYLDSEKAPGLVTSIKPIKSFSWDSTNAVPRAVGLTFISPDLDVPRMVRDGRVLQGSGKITIYDSQGNAHLYLSGALGDGVSYSTADKAVSVALVDSRPAMGVLVPPLVIDEKRFSTATDEMGSLGSRDNYVFGLVVGMPVHQVFHGGSQYYAIGQAGLDVRTVYNDDNADYSSYAGSAIRPGQEDDIGGVFTRFDTAIIAQVANIGDPVWATVEAPEHPHVIELCLKIAALSASASPMDARSWGAALAKADPGLKCDGYIGASAGAGAGTLIEVIENNLFRQFPMLHGVWTGEGYGCVYVDRRSAPVLALAAGTKRLPGRISSITEVNRSSWYNKITVNFRYNYRRANYSFSYVADSSNNAICKVGEDLARDVIERAPLDCPYIRTSGIATKVANWLAAHYALPSYRARYVGHPDLFTDLNAGDTVALSDDEMGWENVQAVVEYLELKELASTEIVFRVWPSSFAELGG